MLALDREERTRVVHGRAHLGAIAHQPGVGEQSPHARGRVLRDLARIEAIEGPAIRRALAQDDRPAQPRLRAFEDQELEEAAIAGDRDAPLGIVIANVEWCVRPRAASDPALHPPVRIPRASAATIASAS